MKSRYLTALKALGIVGTTAAVASPMLAQDRSALQVLNPVVTVSDAMTDGQPPPPTGGFIALDDSE